MPVQKKHSTVYTISVAGKTIPGIQPESKKPKRNYCHRKYLQYGALAILGLVIIVAVVMFFTIKDDEEEAAPWYSKKMCPNVAKCSKSGYSKPPLLLISIDGFRRDYLGQPGWAPWLKKVVDCGVTAEKVYPVYPSSTFPNHYTQVTGLYPIYHGIVDNSFWDREIDKNPVRMTQFTAEHFKGIPIWKHYMATGGRANCFFWPGSDQHHCSEYVPFNGSIPPEDRVAKVQEWLNLPEEKRPGLVTLYFNQVDSAGHRNTQPNILDSETVKLAVKEMDQLLHDFFQSLAEDGILNCVNIVIMSDHGMIAVNRLENATKVEDYIIVGAPVSKIYRNQTENLGELEFEEVFEILSDMGINQPTDAQNPTTVCHQNNQRFLVTTDANRPPRLHYSGSQINGDLIVEGRPGVVFTTRPPWKGSVHGYDYLYLEMQTIFFARGPAFRPGVVLPAFQQIEYFNLFLDLLRLEYVANNGTVGIFDPAMVNPPKRSGKHYKGIEACPTAPNISLCCSSPPICFDDKSPQLFSSNLDYCFLSGERLCGKTVYRLKSNWVAVVETLSIGENKERELRGLCSIGLDNATCGSIQPFFSLSADPNVKISSLQLPVFGHFMRRALSALDELQKELLEKTSSLYALSGTAVDKNRDVQADNEDEPATHFYRLYVYCKDGKYSDKAICQEKDQLATLGFIFPLIEEDLNCLKSKELLLYYSARLKDVETISGLELMLDGYTDHERAVLRTKIVDHL